VADVPEEATRPSGRLRGRVLLVEDNPVNLMVAQRLVGLLGLQCETADNGEKALERMVQGNLDVVLMDCQMPVKDGYTASREWRQHEVAQGLPRLPIIAMTANAMAGDRQKCLDAGMDDYLSKPVDRRLLEATIARWLQARPVAAAGEDDAAPAPRAAALPPRTAQEEPVFAPRTALDEPMAAPRTALDDPMPAPRTALDEPLAPSLRPDFSLPPRPAAPAAPLPPRPAAPAAPMPPRPAMPAAPAAPLPPRPAAPAAPRPAMPAPPAAAPQRPAVPFPPRQAPSSPAAPSHPASPLLRPAAAAPEPYSAQLGGDAPPAPPPVLASEVVDELRAVMGNEYLSLVRLFLEDAPKHVQALEAAATAADMSKMVAPAHTLKSAAANLGAMALSAAAKRIELGARQGVLPRPAVAVAVLESEFRRASAALNALLK
jgi:CheY-like chemotaxis protein/HPt (histidine-containing phosphotransfer) domain-containing protein